MNFLFKFTWSCPFTNYFPQSFQIFTPSLFMGSIPEKNEKFANLLDTFLQGPKKLSFKIKSLQSVSNLNQILTNLVFWWFLFSRNPKTVFWTVYSNSHQTVLPKTTSRNLFQIFTPSLFMGSVMEKNKKFFNLFGDFFSRAQRALFQNKVFTIFLQSLSNFNKLSFLMISLFVKSKNSFFELFIQIHIKVSFQTLLLTIFSRFLLHLFSWVLFWRKMRSLSVFWRLFFKGPKSSLLKKSLYNLFTILIK